MSTSSGDSSFGLGSPLQYYQAKPFSMEDIEGFNSTSTHFTSSCTKARPSSNGTTSTTTGAYRRTQPYSPASVGTPATCSSDESLPDGNEDELLGGTTGPSVGTEHKKIRRIQANKRERKRMHTVNSAFDDLRDLVPTYPTNRKLSKIETLRLACAYIQDLAKLLNESNAAAVHGEDVNLIHHPSSTTQPSHLPPPHYDGFMQQPAATLHATATTSQPNGMAGYSPVKTELSSIPSAAGDFNNSNAAQCNGSFKHYRIPLSYDYESCPSDPELQSPPNYHAGSGAVYMIPPGLAVKPPALARVSSDTAVSLQLSQASLNNGHGNNSSGYCGSPAGPIAPCSPLTRVTHSSPSQHSRNLTTGHFTASSSYHHYNTPSTTAHSSFMHHHHHSTPHHHHTGHHSASGISNGYGLVTQCYSQ